VKGVPEGWEVVRIDSLYKTSSGGTPSREKPEYYDNGIYNWIKTGELNDSFVFETDEKITEIGLKKSSAKLFPPYTTIFAMYGNTIGQLGITTMPSATNQACCALMPLTKEFDFEFLFLTLLLNRNEIISFGMGAAQQNVNQDELKKYKILKPTSDLAVKFKTMTNPIFQQIEILTKQNTQLRQIRDRLLPRLISGKLEVNIK
jgi:type I restriction enzyme S subunit